MDLLWLWDNPLVGALVLYIGALTAWGLSRAVLVGWKWLDSYRLRHRRRKFMQRLLKKYGPKWNESHHAVAERMYGDLDVTGMSDACQHFQDEVKRIHKV